MCQITHTNKAQCFLHVREKYCVIELLDLGTILKHIVVGAQVPKLQDFSRLLRDAVKLCEISQMQMELSVLVEAYGTLLEVETKARKISKGFRNTYATRLGNLEHLAPVRACVYNQTI